MTAVHGDEIPTAYVLFRLADYLKENPEVYKGRHVVIAPLINPDGFLASPSRRVNTMGVAMILGTWSAKRAIERMPRETFQRLVAVLLVAIAGYMVVHG